MANRPTVKITIAGQPKSGKTRIALLVGEVLSNVGLNVAIGDDGAVWAVGHRDIGPAMERQYRDDVKKLAGAVGVAISTVEQQRSPKKRRSKVLDAYEAKKQS